VNAIFRHDYPLAVESGSTPRPLVQKKLGEILYLLICSFLPCLSWLLHSRVRKSRRDLWITLYVYFIYVCVCVCVCVCALKSTHDEAPHYALSSTTLQPGPFDPNILLSTLLSKTLLMFCPESDHIPHPSVITRKNMVLPILIFIFLDSEG